LARGNPQWPGVLDWFSKSKISWFNFLVGLKAQSKCCEKIRLGSGFYKIFEIKKWLNMNSKPDNKGERSGDII
jgi:hypothetical protein